MSCILSSTSYKQGLCKLVKTGTDLKMISACFSIGNRIKSKIE